MTTDKMIAGAAKTFQETVNGAFQENMNNGIKWFQTANAALFETQNKQVKAANDIYNKMVNSVQGDGKLNLDFGASGKTMMDTLQKNVENFSNISSSVIKAMADLGKEVDTEFVLNDGKRVFDLYNKQVEELNKLNQQSFDAIVKQFDVTKFSFSPLAENLKKELDTILDSSKESIQTAMDSYNKLAVSSVETNKEVADKLIGQMNAGIAANLKAWKDLIDSTAMGSIKSKDAEKSNVEVGKVKSEGGFKKQGASVVN